MFRIQLSDESGVDTGLAMSNLTARPRDRRESKTVRFLKSDRTHEDLLTELGANYGQALLDGDPEYTIGATGKLLGKMERVWLSDGAPRYVPPVELDIVKDKDGKETERHEPRDVLANVATDCPLVWRGEPIDREDAARKFVFRRTLQIQHRDGLTYRFCHAMAKKLYDADTMVHIRGGADGKQPLVLAKNGTPHWGLLEGRVRGL